VIVVFVIAMIVMMVLVGVEITLLFRKQFLLADRLVGD
jgi:hypothetical protein